MSDEELDPRGLLRLGSAAERRGDRAHAARLYERAAGRFAETGHMLKAVAVWGDVLRLEPAKVDIRLRLAEGLAGLGLLEDAKGHFRRVLEDASEERQSRLRERAALGLLAAEGASAAEGPR